MYKLSDSGLTSGDFLLYCFYGGKVCIAVHDDARALRLLELGVSTPTSVGDAIILASWQHYQLLHALRLGAFPAPRLLALVFVFCLLLSTARYEAMLLLLLLLLQAAKQSTRTRNCRAQSVT